MRKLIVLISAIALFSCSKYEDNNGIYLTSKMHRLTQKEWHSEDGLNKTKFNKDGTGIFYSYNFEWEFVENKNNIVFHYELIRLDLEVKIMKLTNKEFQYEYKEHIFKFTNE